MNSIEYRTMAEREQTYWWHIGRLKIIGRYLAFTNRGKQRPTILNVGCGTGGTIAMLEAVGPTDNIDISDEAIAFMKERGHTNITKVGDTKLPFADATYDIVCAFDVLEHIENDITALAEWQRVMKDGGAIVLTVPAYQWLWSEHDVSLHHYRRYTTKRLEIAAKRAGLTIEKISYAMVFSLPLIAGFRFLNKILQRKVNAETSYVPLPGWINMCFIKLLLLEAVFHTKIAFPAGTSVIAILRKN